MTIWQCYADYLNAKNKMQWQKYFYAFNYIARNCNYLVFEW